MRFMLGGAINRSKADNQVEVSLTSQVALGTTPTTLPTIYDEINDNITYTLPEEYKFINMTQGVRGQVTADNTWDKAAANFKAGDIVRFFWVEKVTKDDAAVEITISPNTFPGTYRIVGDTFKRSADDARDVPYQFVIGKAKNLVAA